MTHIFNHLTLCLAAAIGLGCVAAQAQETPLGADLAPLLTLAKAANPEYSSMRFEAQAATERITPAGALADPKFRTELRDITKMGEQSPTLSPSDVGSTRYLLMQDIPWFGKRDLKRDIAAFEAQGSHAKALSGWSELTSKIKTAQAQRYFLQRNTQLTQEIMDLVLRLEKVAQSRYASGLAPQQDVIRAQMEQTKLKDEQLGLARDSHQVNARLNALLARPATAPLAPPISQRALPPPEQLDATALEARVRAHNPLLFAETARLQAAEKNRELTYKNRYPDFTLGISPIQYQGAIKEWELMVEINIPLQQASRRAQEREAEAMLSAAQSRQAAAANQLLADLSENLSALASARRSEQLATTQLLPQGELTFSAALAGYENGKVDFATLLDAQRQISQARQSQARAQLEAQLRLADIEKQLGED